MTKIARFKLPILVLAIALVAGGAGLYFAGMLPGTGGSEKAHMNRVDPISFKEPFVVNLADSEEVHYAKLRVALMLDPMTDDQLHAFKTPPESGGHGGGGEEVSTGISRIALDPMLRDATIEVVSGFTSDALRAPGGKEKLRVALVAAYAAVYDREKRPVGKHTRLTDEQKLEPYAHGPWSVQAVYLEEFAVQ